MVDVHQLHSRVPSREGPLVKRRASISLQKTKITIGIYHLCLWPPCSNFGSAIFNLTEVKTVSPHVYVVQDHFVLDGQSSKDFNGNLVLC